LVAGYFSFVRDCEVGRNDARMYTENFDLRILCRRRSLFNATASMYKGIRETLADGDELDKAIERVLRCGIFAAERYAELRRARAHDNNSAFCLLQFRDGKATQMDREHGEPQIDEDTITPTE